ncbi:ribonuclease H-like domain-containing protein [Tuber borchii]|uniref:Ribonuclease H-like domain-containing protein n=1 Tax=Tuber borchii TaxID=42251 RepID=A0A2T6ZTK4_TUBBO|nr:ribonuclease H-like domain-containing protein [Tuber borchii]
MAQRWQEILQGVETAVFMKFAAAPAFARRGQIDASLEEVGWRCVGSLEELVFGQGTENSDPKNGRWNLRGKRFYKPTTLNGYGLLYVPGGHVMRVDQRGIDTFTKTYGQQFPCYGVLSNPRCSSLWAMANPQGDFEPQIHELTSKLQTSNGVRPNLIIFILPNAAVKPYCTIKKICDTTFGIASQCIVLEKCFNPKGQLQYSGNIALKQPEMIMGCDASHPSLWQPRMYLPPPTFTAISASYDRRCAKYSAVTSGQDAGQEIIQDFGAMTQELLKRFQEQAKRDPAAIVYFRDGLSESEFDKVVRYELSELKKVTKAKVLLYWFIKGELSKSPKPGDVEKMIQNAAKNQSLKLGAEQAQATSKVTKAKTVVKTV